MQVDTFFQRDGLAHVLPGGTLDKNWKPSIEGFNKYVPDMRYKGRITKILFHQGTLYINGDFSSIDGAKRQNLAALDGATGALLTWYPRLEFISKWYGSDLGGASELRANKDTIFIAGYFHFVNGVTRNGLAAVNAQTGETLEWNPRLATSGYDDSPGRINDFSIHNGVLYAVGYFKILGDTVFNKIGGFKISDGQKAEVKLPANLRSIQEINQIRIVKDLLYLKGVFKFIVNGRYNYYYSFFLNPQTGERDTSFKEMASPYTELLDIFYIQNDTLCGYNYTRGALRYELTQFDLNTRQRLHFTTGIEKNEKPLTLAADASSVFIGGDFDCFNCPYRTGIAAIYARTCNLLPFYPKLTDYDNTKFSGSVIDLALKDSILYVSGEFSYINGEIRIELAALNVQTGQLTKFNPDFGYIESGGAKGGISVNDKYVGFAGKLRGYDGEEFYGAILDRFSGALRFRIKDLSSYADTARPSIYKGDAVFLTDSTYYFAVSAYFGDARLIYSNIQKGRLSDGAPYAWKPQVSGVNYTHGVTKIEEYKDKLYVCGNFNQINGETRKSVAAFDPKTGLLDPNWRPAVSHSDGIMIQNDIMFLTGYMLGIDEIYSHYIGALKTESAAAFPCNTDVVLSSIYGHVTDVVASKDKVWVAGSFVFHKIKIGMNFSVFGSNHF